MLLVDITELYHNVRYKNHKIVTSILTKYLFILLMAGTLTVCH